MVVDIERALREYDDAVRTVQELRIETEKQKQHIALLEATVADAIRALKTERARCETWMRGIAEAIASLNNMTCIGADMVEKLSQLEYRPNGNVAIKEENAADFPSCVKREPIDLDQLEEEIKSFNKSSYL